MAQIGFILENVKKLISKFDTRDPFKICKNMNIKIHYKDLGPSLKAYYFCQSRIKNIVSNSNSDEIMCRILCAHELGHALLHNKSMPMYGFQEFNVFNTTIVAEYEANLFAAELLLSDDKVLEALNCQEKSILEIARELYIPTELIIYKLQSLNKRGFEITIPDAFSDNFLKKIC